MNCVICESVNEVSNFSILFNKKTFFLYKNSTVCCRHEIFNDESCEWNKKFSSRAEYETN